MFVALQIVAMTLISAGSAGEITPEAPALAAVAAEFAPGSTERALNVSHECSSRSISARS